MSHDVSTADKLAAVRVRDVNKDPHFPGASHSHKYNWIVPRLDTFYVGRIQYATLESIHRLKAQLLAERNPNKPRRGRPRKLPAAQSVEASTRAGGHEQARAITATP